MRKFLLMVLILVGVVLMFSEPLKVAFVYVGSADDQGWSTSHDIGRQHMEQQLGDLVTTSYIEDVPDSSESLSVIAGYARKGYDVVFTTSFGFMNPTLKAAQQFPDTIFMHCSGYLTNDNMGTYFGRMYEPRYLTGLIAGMMCPNDTIGFVAAHPIPEVIRAINAFALGVKEINPDITIKVVWTNTWFDPTLEMEAAISLLDTGVGLITQDQDSPATQQAAEKYGVLGIGYNSNMEVFAPNVYLGSAVWNWGAYYTKVVQSVIDGTWESEQYWGGMKDDIVQLVMSDLVPDNVKQLVYERQEQIINGDFHPFTGEIYDNEGNLKCAEGEILSDAELLSMTWFVDNVEGTL